MVKKNLLSQIVRKRFEEILALEEALAEIAAVEADGLAMCLLHQIDNLKSFISIFQDPSDHPEDIRPLPENIRPLIDAARLALDDIYRRKSLSGLSVEEQWQIANFYLRELLYYANAFCKNSGHVPGTTLKEEDTGDGETESMSMIPEATDPLPKSITTEGPGEENQAETPLPADLPISSLADMLPVPKGPTVYFLIKTLAQAGNTQKIVDQIKMALDNAPPMMGETGKRFFYPLDLGSDKNFDVVQVEGSRSLTETLGLTATLEAGQIILQGNALSTSFDGHLYFSFARSDHPETVQIHTKPMYIAADPRSLWKDLPVEDFEGYPVADDAMESLPLPEIGKIVVAASCRGRSHAHTAKPRDDSFLIDFDSNAGWVFVAVADGAGSSRFSRKGAALACKTVVGSLRRILESPRLTDFFQANQDRLAEWKEEFEAAGGNLASDLEEKFCSQMAERSGIRLSDIVYKAVYEAYMAIEQEAKAKQAQVRDYHTTLLCAAFRKFSFGYFIITYWIGDGAMGVYNWNQQDRVLIPGIPDGGEFAGQTKFLTLWREEINPEAVRKRTRYIFADDFDALILATDGVIDPFFFSEKSVLDEANWRNFWNQTLQKGDADAPPCPELFSDETSPRQKAQALRHWLNFWSKGNHDDRTILIVK